MKIALGQIQSSKDFRKNLTIIEDYSQQAAQAGAQLVVFPEAAMLSFGGSMYQQVLACHEPWRQELARIARETGCNLIAGGFRPEPQTNPSQPRIINSLYLHTPAGQEYVYDKIHLYDAYGIKESDGVCPGRQLVTVELAGTTLGLTLCYDVRFGQLYTQLSRAGAEIMIVAASWAAGPGKIGQWQVLTSARALDSNAFVVAVDQADPGSVNSSSNNTAPLGVGYSRVVSPFGQTLLELDAQPQLQLIDLDLDQVKRAAQELPILAEPERNY